MGKALFIAEKPSVARDFVKILNVKGKNGDGFIEGDRAVFTWCVGHLVNMCYPEAYDEELKRWSLTTLPFIPTDFKYDVIPSAAKQFQTVKRLLKREDIDTIYVCTDSGREGEYIYRLVDMMVGVKDKEKKRVWIDSQTEEEIKRGIKEAKPLSEYDSLADSAYLRAKEDYLVGINFSRLLTLIYGNALKDTLKTKKNVVIAVGRVMSCVLAMIVEREREVRNFKKTNFYKVIGEFKAGDKDIYEGQWKAVEGSKYFESRLLYNEGGFLKKEDCEEFLKKLVENSEDGILKGVVESVSKKKEKKNAPLLFNLAEMQNECSKRFKINPDQTLSHVQSLYEKKMLTYPRTDARVLSTAVAKEVDKNLKKLLKFINDSEINSIVKNILDKKLYKGLEKTKYVDDKKITDHYAIIPTGEGLNNYENLPDIEKKIYNLVLRRFLAVFYPQAIYSKIAVVTKVGDERFFTSNKVLVEKGYLEVLKPDKSGQKEDKTVDLAFLNNFKKGKVVEVCDLEIKEGETSPPKRYTTGTIILAMENAGKLIEDEELREQIKGSGIGTSATRAEILRKLVEKNYVKLNNKTQILTPEVMGEFIYDIVKDSIPSLLNPRLTASWEKGLKMVVDKEIKSEEFMNKLEDYIKKNTSKALSNNRSSNIQKIIGSTADANKVKIDNSGSDKILGICPLCRKGHIIKNSKGYGCTNWQSGCKFFIAEIAGVKIPVDEIRSLIEKGRTNTIRGFTSRKGSKFDACLKITEEGIKFDFDR